MEVHTYSGKKETRNSGGGGRESGRRLTWKGRLELDDERL